MNLKKVLRRGIPVSLSAVMLFFASGCGSKPAEEARTGEVESTSDATDIQFFSSSMNPSINMELWGNTCEVVCDLLGGKSVDECMDTIDQLQAEANAESGL